jgi:ATP adenylyltransferase
MVCPYQHAHCITELDAETNAEVMTAAQLMLPVLRSVMNCQGFNIGYNIGKAAGAGIEEHLHLHIIPRWAGDSNILPVLSDTRVISEHIEETWERLRRGLAEHGIADSPNRA